MTRILVVDDSLSVRKALEKILNSLAEVSVADSAEDALAQLFSDVPLPDLIISDVLMPGMSGPELAKSLRLLQQTARVPVILISGSIDDEVHRQAHEVGAHAVVRKPFSAEDLLPVVWSALHPGEAPPLVPTQGTVESGSPQEAIYEPELDTGLAHLRAAQVEAHHVETHGVEVHGGETRGLEAQHAVQEAATSAPAVDVAGPLLTQQSGAASVEALLNPALAASSDADAVAAPNLAQTVVLAPGAAGAQAAEDHHPQAQPRPGQNHPERNAAGQPAAVVTGHADHAGLVEALMQKPGVVGALVSDTAGVTHSQAGDLTLSASDLSMYARFFVGTADALGQRLGRGEALGTQLDYRNGALLLLPLDPGHLLVCLLADANSGSMVRFTVRRHSAATVPSF